MDPSILLIVIILIALIAAAVYWFVIKKPDVDCVQSAWGVCSPSSKTQSRIVTTKQSGNGKVCGVISKSCTPNIDCAQSAWSVCASNELQTRTTTMHPSGIGKKCGVSEQSCLPSYMCKSDTNDGVCGSLTNDKYRSGAQDDGNYVVYSNKDNSAGFNTGGYAEGGAGKLVLDDTGVLTYYRGDTEEVQWKSDNVPAAKTTGPFKVILNDSGSFEISDKNKKIIYPVST